MILRVYAAYIIAVCTCFRLTLETKKSLSFSNLNIFSFLCCSRSLRYITLNVLFFLHFFFVPLRSCCALRLGACPGALNKLPPVRPSLSFSRTTRSRDIRHILDTSELFTRKTAGTAQSRRNIAVTNGPYFISARRHDLSRAALYTFANVSARARTINLFVALPRGKTRPRHDDGATQAFYSFTRGR